MGTLAPTVTFRLCSCQDPEPSQSCHLQLKEHYEASTGEHVCENYDKISKNQARKEKLVVMI